MKKLLFLIVPILCTLNAFCQNPYYSDLLKQKLSDTKNDRTIPVFIVLNEQLDFVSLKKLFNDQKMPLKNRAGQVISMLRNQSASSQKNLVESISSSTRDGHKIKILKQYFICNMILVEANASSLKLLENRTDIRYFDYAARGVDLIEPFKGTAQNSQKDAVGPEPGLVAINAPALWALGYTGRGTLIYGYDTGVWPDHPSFSDRYLGRYYPPEQCWYGFWNEEPTGILNDHGTHTLGTAIGLDKNAADTIGVAFEAYWIATDIIKGTIDEVPPVSDLVDAFEWALNPDGDFSTVNDIPHVINNSWRWRDEIDTVECEGFVVDLLNAIEAVGIANIFSGGNSGPDNTGVNSPQRVKINEVNTFCVGAIDGNVDPYPIVYFSTRGPSQCLPSDSALSIHPEVVAPGYYVRSAWGSNEYNSISGTSMSCPHVSGAVLLLKEAFPYLPGEDLMRALYYTAIDKGDAGEDNVYGMGLIDVYAAYEYLAASHTPVAPHYPWDISIAEIFSPEWLQYCQNNLTPHVKIANKGESTVSHFQLSYELNGTAIDTIYWNGSLLPGDTVTIDLPEMTSLLPGESIFRFHVYLADSLTEVDNYNNHRYFRTNIENPFAVPFFEDFESGIDTMNWTIINPDGGITWDTLSTGGLGENNHSLFMSFGYESPLYEKDEIITPPIDLSTSSETDTVTLTFDLAYQKRSNTFIDSLTIFMSTDCGNSYPFVIYAKNGTDLSTWDTITPDFMPELPEQWRREHIPITGLDPDAMVRFKLVGKNKRGNHLYIDNFTLDPGMVEESVDVVEISSIRIYPNPATSEVTLSGLKGENLIMMYNLTGSLMYQAKTEKESTTINLEKFSSGIYYIKVFSGEKSFGGKVVVE